MLRALRFGGAILIAAGALACGGGGDGTVDVEGVDVSGTEDGYTFAVTLRSDETGCDQYADWWEVVTPAGQLVYRLTLDHSHPDEQPFTREGGPVPVLLDDEIIVRGHMNPEGYEGHDMHGSVASGFSRYDPEAGFAGDLASLEPQPVACEF